MSVGADLVDVFAAAIEQAGPEAKARLRAALDLDPAPSPRGESPAVYTPATLAAEVGRSPKAIRDAIARGELDAVKRGRGWLISADAVERWAAADRGAIRASRNARPRRSPGRGPMGRALA